MEIKLSKELPKFSYKNKDKRILVIEFPNCISTTTNEPFKWVPSYSQMEQIKKALKEIEEESWNNGVH